MVRLFYFRYGLVFQCLSRYLLFDLWIRCLVGLGLGVGIRFQDIFVQNLFIVEWIQGLQFFFFLNSCSFERLGYLELGLFFLSGVSFRVFILFYFIIYIYVFYVFFYVYNIVYNGKGYYGKVKDRFQVEIQFKIIF